MESNGSLADSLANLLTPAPTINDADIDAADATSAQLAQRPFRNRGDDANEEDVDDATEGSQLRRRAAPLLGQIDAKYAGKTVSRKAALDGEEDYEDEDGDEEGTEDEVSEGDEDDDEKDSEDEMDPEFKKILMGANTATDGNDLTDEDVEDDDVEDDEEEEEEDDGDDEVKTPLGRGNQKTKASASEVGEDKNDKTEESRLQLFEKKLRERHEKQLREDQMRKEMVKKARAEKLKGVAVKRQLKRFDELLEMRIRLQKGLELVNRLPRAADVVDEGTAKVEDGQTWSDFVSSLPSSADRAKLEKCQKTVANLSQSVLGLQTTLLSSIEDTRGAIKSTKSLHDCDQILDKRHHGVRKYRDETLTKWQEKTAMTTAKSFHAFDTPILEQINLILADKERLLGRTRTNRQRLTILGKRKREKESDDDEEKTVERMRQKKDGADGFEVDEQIFDDSDFYQHLLRELIERKSSQITDSHALGKQMVQLHKLRIKNKKKVDTRASKGRKVRYDTHQKLIGFCAAVVSPSSMSDSARDELFKSLFGQRWTKNGSDADGRTGAGDGETEGRGIAVTEEE